MQGNSAGIWDEKLGPEKGFNVGPLKDVQKTLYSKKNGHVTY